MPRSRTPRFEHFLQRYLPILCSSMVTVDAVALALRTGMHCPHHHIVHTPHIHPHPYTPLDGLVNSTRALLFVVVKSDAVEKRSNAGGGIDHSED